MYTYICTHIYIQYIHIFTDRNQFIWVFAGSYSTCVYVFFVVCLTLCVHTSFLTCVASRLMFLICMLHTAETTAKLLIRFLLSFILLYVCIRLFWMCGILVDVSHTAVCVTYCRNHGKIVDYVCFVVCLTLRMHTSLLTIASFRLTCVTHHIPQALRPCVWRKIGFNVWVCVEISECV